MFTNEIMYANSNMIPNLDDIFTGDQNEVLCEVNITEDIVFSRLRKLKVSKAPGIDGLVPKFLVETAGNIGKPLNMIFNASLNQGVVPMDWRRANVSAIYKKGPRDKPENYRPVSLTCQVCKLLESVLRDSIVEHLQLFSLIKDTQHGFVKKRSCLSNLLKFLNFTCNQVDSGEAVDVIYLDFQKALDKVPHKRLIRKVQADGVGGKILRWITNWLTDREQRVMIKQYSSQWSNVLSGVPQGPVLDPLLFVIYINDIDNSVISKLSKFADDTKVFNVVSRPDQVEVLKTDLRNL